MKKVIFLIIILSVVVPRTVSQEVVEHWSKAGSPDPGESFGRKVMVDGMGNVYVLGRHLTLGTFVLKYNAQGDPYNGIPPVIFPDRLYRQAMQ